MMTDTLYLFYVMYEPKNGDTYQNLAVERHLSLWRGVP